MLEVAISPATLKMLATTAVIVGTEQAAGIVHNNMSQDTVTDAGTAYASALEPESVAPREERSLRGLGGGRDLADVNKLRQSIR